MSAPSSVEEVLQLIRKSGMVDENKLAAWLHRRQAGRGLPDDPREAADAMIADGLITNFQAEQFLLGKWRGFTIGKYKLLERVGVGGMGQVFLCEHLFMKRRVAVKVLPPAKAEQPAALGRFYREARAAGSLEHPHIVRTHDIDQDGNLHFIVMEYVNGTNLLDVVKKFGPMDVRRAAEYTRQVASGLDYAFKSGIIHRDIKPGNVLIDRRGTAKLLDMGLARFYMDQSDQLTIKYDDKIVLGTADYVAPEQVANSHTVDVRADIYGLGASLYFLLAGHPPFPTGTVSQKLLWHRTKDPTPIRQIRPEVPEGLAAAVAKMMHKDPAQRFQTPAEVAAEMERWVPANVPLPAAEEMPELSAAAMAGEDDASREMAAVSESKMMATLTQTGRERVSPFAPPAAPVYTPEPPPVEMHDSQPIGTATAAALATASKAARTRPSPSVFGPSPFAPLPEAPPVSAATATPSPFHPTRPGPVAPGMFPVIAVPPKDHEPTLYRGWLIGLIAASVVVAGGLVAYKLTVGKAPDVVPAQTPQ